MKSFVTQAKTDHYVRAAVAVHVTFVAGKEVECVVAVDRGVGVFIITRLIHVFVTVGKQLTVLPRVAVLDISILGSTLPVADG